jgi:hypothetical protein
VEGAVTHLRQLLREAIAQAVGGSTSRVRPTRDEELPCRIVYAVNEAAELLTVSGTLKRTATVLIEVRAKATPGFDDELDAHAESIEAAMDADPKFGNLALNSWLAQTQITIEAESEKPQAVMRLAYSVLYAT